MHGSHLRESFIIEMDEPRSTTASAGGRKPNFSAMKLFNRFRKILTRLVFSFPASSSSSRNATQKGSVYDRFEPPKTSCSSYYSSQTHYSEAIADCIEFLNKSSSLEHRDSDFFV